MHCHSLMHGILQVNIVSWDGAPGPGSLNDCSGHDELFRPSSAPPYLLYQHHQKFTLVRFVICLSSSLRKLLKSRLSNISDVTLQDPSLKTRTTGRVLKLGLFLRTRFSGQPRRSRFGGTTAILPAVPLLATTCANGGHWWGIGRHVCWDLEGIATLASSIRIFLCLLCLIRSL